MTRPPDRRRLAGFAAALAALVVWAGRIPMSRLALVAFAYAIERLGAATAASVTPLSPVQVATLGWLLLGDAIDAPTARGLLAVGAGVLIANRRAAPVATSR